MIESRPESRMSDAHITSEPDRVESATREVRTYLYSYHLHKLVQSLLLRENNKSVGKMFTGKLWTQEYKKSTEISSLAKRLIDTMYPYFERVSPAGPTNCKSQKRKMKKHIYPSHIHVEIITRVYFTEKQLEVWSFTIDYKKKLKSKLLVLVHWKPGVQHSVHCTFHMLLYIFHAFFPYRRNQG